MRGVKKPAAMASRDFALLFGKCSKQALIDALWCACQLGTDESDAGITTQAARNMIIALRERGDVIPTGMEAIAEQPIDSD